MKTTKEYVVFLRGINVGGNKKISMAQLKQVFEKCGFSNVKTLLNSGNVVFSTDHSQNISSESITEFLDTLLGQKIYTILRSSQQLRDLIKLNPFENIIVTSETRLYVTFLPKHLKIDKLTTSNENFKILNTTDTEFLSVVTLTSEYNTTDLMSIIEKHYGKQVTTRSW